MCYHIYSGKLLKHNLKKKDKCSYKYDTMVIGSWYWILKVPIKSSSFSNHFTKFVTFTYSHTPVHTMPESKLWPCMGLISYWVIFCISTYHVLPVDTPKYSTRADFFPVCVCVYGNELESAPSTKTLFINNQLWVTLRGRRISGWYMWNVRETVAIASPEIALRYSRTG